MSETLRKGWCPGALQPMQARDGLLVRLRITGGIVPAPMALALADLARCHGNGLFDLSARANLQLRGVTQHTLFPLQNALRDLGILDADVGAESVRNVIASPLAGLHAGLDIGPLVTALETMLADTPALHALPGKFVFLVDDGRAPSLDGVAADVRFDWDDHTQQFGIGLGGTAEHALRIGQCRPDRLVARATPIAEGAIGLFARSRTARRMRTLRHEFGGEEVAQICGGTIAAGASECRAGAWTDPAPLSGVTMIEGAPVLGLTAPFGRLDHTMLDAAARVAMAAGGTIRLTPWRTLLVPGATDPDRCETAGFIIDRDDPRLGVAACTGREGCVRGTTSTQSDAVGLADLARALPPGRGTVLHVSGCQKGCAKPAPSAITLVGHDGRYDLVRDGNASDFPIRRNLDLDEVRAAIEAILEHA